MNLIHASYEILTPIEALKSALSLLETAGRVCYKSEDKITPVSAEPFIKGIIQRGHESVIEHISLSVRFVVDRGVSHELVRHRLASFSQESTRYCNYGKKGVTFVIPPWCSISPGEYGIGTPVRSYVTADSLWFQSMWEAAISYNLLLQQGWTPQQARSVLPNSLKTEVVMTANLREWRHILNLRTSKVAHPQMLEVMIPLLRELQSILPVIFGDIVLN